jgi:hypothetical protein
MCGRIRLATEWSQIKIKLRLDDMAPALNLRPSWNIPPTRDVVSVRSEPAYADRPPAGHRALIFHAGTELLHGRLVSSGERVLTVCAWAEDLAACRRDAYSAVDAVDWPDGFCRRDIGWRAVARAERR